MRSSLLASLALTATLTSAFAPSIADACGGYMPDPRPAVFAVDYHSAAIPGAYSYNRQLRAFVVLGATGTKADLSWALLAPGTYDSTQIADLPDPKESTTFTLVGPSGTRVVSTNRSALLAGTFRNQEEHSTLEVDIDQKQQFQIAVLGTQPDATWLPATGTTASKQTLAWVKAQGLDTTYVYVSKIKGTKVQVISAHHRNDIGLTSFVVVDGKSVGSYVGNAIGALDLGAKRYVLLETQGVITPVAV